MTDVISRLTAALADRYTIERELGRGGMAVVYLAKDLKHERQVAVKVLRPELAAAVGAERFQQEIKIAANLNHPHVLPLLDSGESEGFLHYVMPYVEGQSLRDKLAKEGELPINDAVRILREVVDALAHAHEQGVVHRDIKPDNVMLSGRHALVTDFGVAKAVSEATGRQKLTTEGIALGTPAYMAPEQAAADPYIDHRADIYAVGVIAYELLTGRTPFVGTTQQELLAAHVTQTPDPVTKYRESVPPALAQLVMKCLEKKAADRWQTAEELLPHLEALATPSGGVAPTAQQPVRATTTDVRNRWPLTVGLAIAIVSLGTAGVLWLRSDRTPAPLNDAREPVLVVPFEVRANSEALAAMGSRTAEQIAAAIVQEGLAEVLPSTTGRFEADPGALPETAAATGAATLVTGTIYQRGDSLEVQAHLVRGNNLRPIYALPVERGLVTAARELADAITERVLGAVGFYMNEDLAKFRSGSQPPRDLETLRLVERGTQLFDERRFAESVPFLEQAFVHDSTLLWVASFLVYGYFNAGRRAERDSMLEYVERRRSRLTQIDALYHNHSIEVFWGSPEDEYRAAIEALAPDTTSWLFNALWSSARANRPEEALRYFRMRDTALTNMERWYDHSSRALHALERFEDLLGHAREARGHDPSWQSVLYWEVRALVALDRSAELEDVLAGANTVDSPTAPGWALYHAGVELWAHGDSSAARQMWQRAIDWVLAQGFEGAGRSSRRRLIAGAYYEMGQYERALEYLTPLSAASPDNASYAGTIGRISAYLGDEAGALEVAQRLLAERRTWLRASHTYQAAKIYAVMGQRERALTLIREALNSGARQWWDLRTSPRDFDSLRGYEPFDELIRPKG